MTLVEYLLLFFSVLMGGGVAFYIQKNNKKLLEIVLSFSGAYILGITVLHLMPAIFTGGGTTIGFFVLLGFLIQLFLEQLSGGVEHGHIHAAHHPKANFALTVMTGLCIHAFLEGMPLTNYESLVHQGHEHNHLLYGVILHKAPAAFALVLLLLYSKFSRQFILMCLVIFAFMSPLGAIVSEFIAFEIKSQIKLMAVVIGSFLHIATTILFETDNSHAHKIPMKRLVAILAGMGLAALTVHS